MIEDIVSYYKRQGAPEDQTALISLLRELQQPTGIPASAVAEAASLLQVKQSLLLAIIKRIPSLRLADTHTLELCSGPNCSKRAQLAAFVEKTYGEKPQGFTLRYVPCMRLCGKGPNLRWDGKVYHGADEALIRRLVEEGEEK